MAVVAYADTSVFGGVFDKEFETPTKAFFELVRSGRFALLVSDISRQEIKLAPLRVREYFEEMLPFMRLVVVDERVLGLRDAYVAARVVSGNWAEDAAHVASATVAGADVIVSWNFRHLVNFERIKAYNAVNARRGYPAIDIRSPLEVIGHEDEDV